MVYKQIGLLSK